MVKPKVPKDIKLETYNDKQKWWIMVKDNCEAMIEQSKNSIKLQESIKDMCESKIKELSD